LAGLQLGRKRVQAEKEVGGPRRVAAHEGLEVFLINITLFPI
jgi:hypothetical protein